MKLTVKRDALLAALGHVRGCVDGGAIPVLANVMLNAQQGTLTVSATNMEIAATETVPAETARTGAITVSGELLLGLVRKLKAGLDVELDSPGPADADVAFKAGRNKSSLRTLPASDFPEMRAGKMPHRWTMPAVDLRRLLDLTRHAHSGEVSRYYLNGVCIHAHDGGLRAIATDGQRLMLASGPAPSSAASVPATIIPTATVDEMRKLLAAAPGDVEVALSETRIVLKVGPVTLTSKLIDGTFPEYERVIPRGNATVLRAPKAALVETISRVAMVGTEKTTPVKLETAGGVLTISCFEADRGTSAEEVDGASCDAEISVGFQARYLADALATVAGDVVEFAFGDTAGPALVRCPGDESALAVIMPMRV